MPLFRPFMLSHRPILFSACCARLFSSSTANRHRNLGEVGPLACQIKSRGVIRLEGPDTIKFLQGLLTNDVRSLADQNSPEYVPTPNVALGGSSPVYSAMLTPQGRFLYDLFLYRPARPWEMLDRTGSGPGSHGSSSAADVIYADVGVDVLDELLDCLKKYRLRSKVEIENVAGQFSCWQRFGGNLSIDSSSEQEPEATAIGWGGGTDRTAESSAQGQSFGWRWYRDPRLAYLGFRGIFPSDTVPPLVESDKEVDEKYYLVWRLERGVAEGSIEISKGDAIPHEYNLTGLNSISFSKGCYVGQELVARTHHRGVIRKRLVPMKFMNESGEEVEQKVAPGAEVVEATSRRKAGNVSTALGSLGMGVLRLEDAFKSSLIISDQPDVKVKVARPEWWPAEWAHELEQRTAVV